MRALNLYTVEQDGQPVAQAMAISQAEAVRLYVESVQQPTMTARLSSPLEARTLAGLPLLTRGEPVRDTAALDLFDGVPVAPVSPVVGAVVDPVLVATYCPPVEVVNHVVDAAEMVPESASDHAEDILTMVLPQHAPIAAVLDGLASGEPMPPADELPTHAERIASAYAAGVEIARQGHTRWSVEFLDANATALRGLRDAAADEVHAEMLRGFADGGVQADQAATQERRRLFPGPPKGPGKVEAKYRNPETGESWSGRGLRPAWLRIAIDGGRDQAEFLIDGQGA